VAELNTDVRFVRGVGEARAKSLAKLGITDLKSLISYFPRAYEDRRESRRTAELPGGGRACVPHRDDGECGEGQEGRNERLPCDVEFHVGGFFSGQN